VSEEMLEDYPRLKVYTEDLEKDFKEVYQALLDIDKYTREIKLCNSSNMPINIDKVCKNILSKTNKALGSDKE
jgi:hypothetical protein